MELSTFFAQVITGEAGYLNISHMDSDGKNWTEEFYEYPRHLSRAIERVESLADRNVYFSPYLFTSPTATRDSAIVGRTIVADLDEANVLTLQQRPTVLVETSPERHQGYWILDSPLDAKNHEKLSKRLTYAIPGCDKTGWYIGKRVRVPNTTNYKYNRPVQIRVVATTGKAWTFAELDELPDAPTRNGVTAESNAALIEKALLIDSGPQEYFAKVRSKLPPKVVTQYNIESPDRSAALWGLMTACFRAGLSTEQTFFLARGSANNKFTGHRFNGDLELLKDVLRAKEATFETPVDTSEVFEKIKGVRRFGGLAHEKLSYIADMIRKDMEERGQFINCADGTTWYIAKEDGRPVPVLTRAESLQGIIDRWYGLNATEKESHYTIANLVSYVANLPATGRMGALSWYDKDTNSILIHTGRKDVLLVSKDNISTVVNGYENIVFPWMSAQEIIQPYYKNQTKQWDDILFDGALDNVTGMSTIEAKAMLKVWLLMVLVRNIVIARPILAIFGQPGAGKSTLFRRIYTLLYGRQRMLSSITMPEAFDFELAQAPLVVFDNVDTHEKWLPDRLALAATVSSVTRRKLYTNAEVITVIRQALVGITAHAPKFGREDVVDRLVLITMERLTNFVAETEIIDYIHSNRSAIWGLVIQDLQKVLAQPMPTEYEQFRIEDFSRYGQWIANAVGVATDFRGALRHITSEQKAFNIEEDQILVDSIDAYMKRKPEDLKKFRTPSEWWAILEVYTKDERAFKATYKNGIVLGKKLWTLQNSLRTIMMVEWELDKKRQTRTWRFDVKE